MSTYDYQITLKKIWEKAVALYQDGKRGSGTYFNRNEKAFLKAIGHSAQEVYDFAEDFNNYGEPDFETFLMIADLRFHYFTEVMRGQNGTKVVDTGDLPPKTDKVRRIVWLPRLIEKARAKLRGEMSDDLMYCCGGDRNFFKKHDIHPAEFLAFVSKHFDEDEAIIDFVQRRSKTAAR